MSCPTCSHTMAILCSVLGVRHAHCGRCGTHRMDTIKDGKVIHTHDTVPSLVYRCRDFEKSTEGLYRMSMLWAQKWVTLGIAESINLPSARMGDERGNGC